MTVAATVANERGCVHCATPDTCHRVCSQCPCTSCCDARITSDNSDTFCLACVRWIGRLGLNIRGTLAQLARDRGTTLAQARADLLAAYHHHHQEEQP